MSDQPAPADNKFQGHTKVELASRETAPVNISELGVRLEIDLAKAKHDLDEEVKKNDHERKKELDALRDRRIIRYVGVVLACLAIGAALIMLLRPGATPADRDNATKIIALILAAFFGFAFGQFTNK